MSLAFPDIETVYGSLKRPEESGTAYAGFHQSSMVLPAGHRRTPECRPLPIDLVWDRDVPLRMRDGALIRVDIFRPKDSVTQLPTLMAWSPYGKTGAGVISLDMIPHRAGVQKSQLSGYEKWEAPDPAEWCSRGYAVVNVDARGVFDSEGNIRWLGTGEGQDGHDAIEEIAKLAWSNGRIALAGNSWLAMAQWFIAAENPPHLTCIAPLEGATDFYRETLCRGGVPFKPFWDMLRTCLVGRNLVEDPVAMVEKYPEWNVYWEDKRARLDKISIPAYILASYSTMIHTEGSFRGFEDIASKDKWLTVHATQEWFDLYSKERIDDLALFFDHYMKDLNNGWNNTPRVRASVLPFNKSAMINIPFSDWPPVETKYQKLYLQPFNTLSTEHPSYESMATYPADFPGTQGGDDSGQLSFSYKFTSRKTLLGYSKAVLFMSAELHDDMDVFVQIRKADSLGNVLEHLNIPLNSLKVSSLDEVEQINPLKYLGPPGILRASHAQLDPILSTDFHPVYAHDKPQKIAPGQIAKLEISIWPTGMLFEPGESLILRIGGHPQVLAEFSALQGRWLPNNKGPNSVHLGGKYLSYISVPFV